MTPAENPFRSAAIDGLAYRFDQGGWASLDQQLQRSGFRFAHEDVDAAARWLADAA